VSASDTGATVTIGVHGINSKDSLVGYQRVCDSYHIEMKLGYGYVYMHLHQLFFKESALRLLIVALKECNVSGDDSIVRIRCKSDPIRSEAGKLILFESDEK